MGDTVAHQIKYCQDHYDELIAALVERQLSPDLSRSSEELIEKLLDGKMDAGLEASTAITSGALSLFGPEAILNQDGCPICTFQNIIIHVADHMAVKYRELN